MRPQLLYLVHRFPYPPDKGDRIRAFHIIRHLSKHADVHLACLADEPVAKGLQEKLGEWCCRTTVHPVSGWSRRWHMAVSLATGGTATVGAFASNDLVATLNQWALETRFDAALASASSMTPYLRLPALKQVPAIVDLVDVDSEKWRQYAESQPIPQAWLYRLEARRLRALEAGLPAWARAITLVSEAEADIYRRFGHPGNVEAVVNGVDLEYFQPSNFADGHECVFVGALDYHPNISGICWFVDQVWPEVRRRVPKARLRIIGRRPVAAVRRLGAIAGVEVVGQVPDVRPYVASAALAVVPLHIARGVQNKLLEAMAMAKAVIATSAALEGVLARPGVHLLKADTTEAWIETTVQLLEDPLLRRRLGQAGRAFVEERHHWDSCLRPLSALLGIKPGYESQQTNGGQLNVLSALQS